MLKHFGGGSDGRYPQADLVLSGGALYGTAAGGGSSLGAGVVFKLNTNGTGFTVLRSFASADGAVPQAGLVLGGTTLYGTTVFGGASGLGTVFKIGTDGFLPGTRKSEAAIKCNAQPIRRPFVGMISAMS